MEYTSADEIAVCNLASISLPRFVDRGTREFNYEKLHEITKIVTTNLNAVIDRNYYPLPEAENSNMKHRPIGIGIQGFADTLTLMRLAFEDEEANDVNKNIFETIYHAAMETSMEIAKEVGPYQTF